MRRRTAAAADHDLVGRILSSLGHRLHRVIISELREGTFYATLILLPSDKGTGGDADQRTVDCRPSDAIALAVQTGAPILVARDVFEAVAID